MRETLESANEFIVQQIRDRDLDPQEFTKLAEYRSIMFLDKLIYQIPPNEDGFNQTEKYETFLKAKKAALQYFRRARARERDRRERTASE
jgi:hypothetical protein